MVRQHHANLYRPFTTLSYLLNYAVLGDGHWLNLALHDMNVALVYALGVLIFGDATAAMALAAIWGCVRRSPNPSPTL